jgi:hypothetical protein
MYQSNSLDSNSNHFLFRQLSFYGFKRLVTGRDKGGYYHKCFLRGQEELALKIQRTKIKGTGPRKPNSMESPAPNFYEMSFLPDTTTTTTTTTTGIIRENKEGSEIARDTNTAPTRSPGENVMEVNSPESFVSGPVDMVDAALMWKGNQLHPLKHQLQVLNELEKDRLVLSHTTSSVLQNLIQARALNESSLSVGVPSKSNTLDDIRRIELMSSPSTDSYAFPMLSKGSFLPPQSLIGLSYSSAIPSIQPSWYNQPSAGLQLSSPTATVSSTATTQEVIRSALSKYFQQKSMVGEFYG